MDKNKLIWTEQERKQVFNCRVFSVWESRCTAPEGAPNGGKEQVFSVIDAKSWVIVVPVLKINENEKKFVMVWQWRHGAQNLSLEFPGGVMEEGEAPEQAANRELREETGYTSNKLTKVGEFSPNPAIMSNKVHFFIAEDLNYENQNLDDDEYVEVEIVDIEKVIDGMGKEPFTHALMASALFQYLKNQGSGV